MSVGVSPRGREMLWGEWQLAAVQFKQCAAGSRAGSGKAWEEKNQLALCLHGDQAFLKRLSAGVLQGIPDARERNRNGLEVFPTGESTSRCLCFPGSCHSRNIQMSFSGGCGYLSRRSEFGLQLNYKVKPLQ